MTAAPCVVKGRTVPAHAPARVGKSRVCSQCGRDLTRKKKPAAIVRSTISRSEHVIAMTLHGLHLVTLENERLSPMARLRMATIHKGFFWRAICSCPAVALLDRYGKITTTEADKRIAKRVGVEAPSNEGLAKLFIGRCTCPRPPAPLLIRLTRVAPRQLDQGNFQGSFKAIQDALCRWLRIDDGRDDVLRFDYRQETGPSAVQVLVESVGGV